MQKAIFLDRDGVLNVDRGDYTYCIEDFQVMPHAKEVLTELKAKGFKLIVITNQAGIAKGIYTPSEMNACHAFLQEKVGHLIDYFYFAPDHPQFSASLSRKPGSLLFEKAISRFDLDAAECWMVGDQERDLIPAKKLGMRTIFISMSESVYADFIVSNLKDIIAVVTNPVP